MFTLDHIAVAATDLQKGTDWVQARLGVALQPGGAHPRYGTHNMLLGLADGLYLEVIAKDPAQTPQAGHSWFGLDHFSGGPRLANWICRADDLAAYEAVAGPAQALTRGDLQWDITVPDGGDLPHGGAYPTLLRWAAGTVHPAQKLTPSGLRLVDFCVAHPDARAIAQMLRMDDPRIRFETGTAGFRATFDGPDGEKVLS
ncbi:Glyoxalase-like domain-containing protein [Yoonia tamlensis]|uniref:Glyoxalase-like domain-containing protein n=1 Tax=Yoonia tamlensis TaxID=390270 RepID=A0A1I6FXC1_9RHOB|nr:VOC family protein [Yoonia tamlensis]SFR34566.1 Glyoxalase-like domain-containing protein [Yoonia tamlensis]